jgi:predicted permease
MAALGKPIAFRGRVFTIVGVTPAAFWGLQPGRQVDVSLPITQQPDMLANTRATWFQAFARLQPGVTLERARSEADTILQSFVQNRERFIDMPSAARGLDRLRARFATPLYALALLAAIVLVVTCANLSNLLLARGVGRAREFAIRLAAGAGAGRLMRQLLTETLLLFLIGAAAGLVVAYLAIEALTGFFAVGRIPIVLDIQYNWRIAAFATGVSLAAALLTGLWPALGAARTDPHGAIKDHDGRVVGSARLTSATRVLVAGQVALSLVLLLTAVMFAKTMNNLRAVDLGFTPAHVLTMSLDPLLTGERVSEAREAFWTRALERMNALPDVRAASLSVLTPLSGRDTGAAVAVPGFQPRDRDDTIVRLNHVSEDYFRTFGIDLIAGRVFTARDVNTAPHVVVVNEAAAAAYFPGRSAIGASLTFGKSDVYQVVGVVRDHKHGSVRGDAPRFAFVPLRQRLDPISRITLAVQSDLPPASLAAIVRREVEAVEPRTLVSDVITAEEQVDATLITEQLLSVLASAFAALAVTLAAIGLYGILSYAVARRTSEFGVRLALGAQPSDIVSVVLRQIARQVAAGIAIGLPLAILTARVARGMLFGVAPGDAASYAFAIAVLAIAAGIATCLPARRAAKIDPMTALRSE